MIADFVLFRVFMYAAANRDRRGVTSGEAFICFTLRSFGFLPDFLLPMAHINIVALELRPVAVHADAADTASRRETGLRTL